MNCVNFFFFPMLPCLWLLYINCSNMGSIIMGTGEEAAWGCVSWKCGPQQETEDFQQSTLDFSQWSIAVSWNCLKLSRCSVTHNYFYFVPLIDKQHFFHSFNTFSSINFLCHIVHLYVCMQISDSHSWKLCGFVMSFIFIEYFPFWHL